MLIFNEAISTDETIPLAKARLFQPPNPDATPRSLFAHKADDSELDYCCASCREKLADVLWAYDDPLEILIYTDGSCIVPAGGSGNSSSRAGCAFVSGPEEYEGRCVQFRQELEGPTGSSYLQTSNRAELRAAIGALQYKRWQEDGWLTVVIATNSQYVVHGITDWIERWAAYGWRTGGRKPVKNRDLWECLLAEVNELEKVGVAVAFWHIPRGLNHDADAGAKEAALTLEAPAKFTRVCAALE